MRCFLLFMMPLFICHHLLAQKLTKKEGPDLDNVFTPVEIISGPDSKAWAAYLKKATVLTEAEAAGIPPGVYKIKVQFVVDQNGYIANVTAKNNPGYGFANKAERIVSGYEGPCKPAMQCGRYVKSYKEEVVSFLVKGQ